MVGTLSQNSMVDIHVFQDAATAARMATEAIRDTFIAAAEVPVLFLVSGGSCFHLLYSLDPTLFDARVTMGVLDERYSTDPQINNYAQFVETLFFGLTCHRGVTTIDTMVRPSETIGEMAQRVDMELKDWCMSHADGKIIILQGIGPDGHTAGMTPVGIQQFTELFENPKSWVVGYNAGNLNPYPQRVTVTMPFLRRVSTSIVYAVGKEKKEALLSALSASGELSQIPARIIREMPHCLLYTDQTVDTLNL
jgi:6-phosphogluconolactonase/glucosamine-6-phosphate isomerase/deaminase